MNDIPSIHLETPNRTLNKLMKTTPPQCPGLSRWMNDLPRLIGALVACFLLSGSVSDAAAPPLKMSFQSYLTDTGGNPLSGTKSIKFNIFATETSTDSLWEETINVAVNSGHFSVVLGDDPVLTPELFGDNNGRFIQLTVDDTVLKPRLQLLTTPFAFIAHKALAVEDGAVNEDQLGDDAVTSDKLEDGAVGRSKLANKAVDTAQLEDDAVVSGKIKNGEVKRDDIAGNAIDSEKIEDRTILAVDIKARQITHDEIALTTIKGENLANRTITGTQIDDGAIDEDQIAGSAVTSGKIANGTITSADIGTGAVGTSELANNSVTTAKLSLSAGGTKLGIGTSFPSTMLHLNSSADVEVGNDSKDGVLMIGSENGKHIALDDDEIMARNNATGSDFYLQRNGGYLRTGGHVAVGQNLVVGGGPNQAANTQIGIKVRSDRIPVWNSNKRIFLESDLSANSGRGKWRFTHRDTSGDDELVIYHDGNPRVYLEENVGGGSWKESSDRRLKKNIEPLTSGFLEKLDAMPPTRFHFKSQDDQAPRTIGLIAQDVQSVFPEFVGDRAGEHLAIDYSKIGVVAVGAVRELHQKTDKDILSLTKENEILKAENAAMKKQFESLLTRLQALENKVR